MSQRSIIVVLAVLALSAPTGCVSFRHYASVVDERDAYRDQLEMETRSEERSRRQGAELASELQSREHALALRSGELAEVRRIRAALYERLRTEIENGQVRLREMRDGLSVELSQEILFPSGSAQVESQGRAVVREVAAELAHNQYRIIVNGHTDDRLIGSRLVERYPSNWELGAARASSVVRLLQKAGLDGRRLVVSSHASQRPVALNEDPAGRARNRRVDIRLRPVTLAE